MTAPVLVFLVEDQDDILMLLQEILLDGGFAVTVARSGEEAVTLLDKEGTTFRALVTDVNLAGTLTGWDVARHAREVNNLLPVVYMTGASAHEWASKGVPNSVILQKPFAMAQVLTSVSQLVTDATTTAAHAAALAARLGPNNPG